MAEAVLTALVACRTAHLQSQPTSSSATTSISGSNEGLWVATQLAEAAELALSSAEIQQLVTFLQEQAAQRQRSELDEYLRAQIKEFHTEECKVSQEDVERLCLPGGPPEADLGLILHIQSEDEQLEGFWDARSATINLLQDKGLSESFCFGFDWHWRADGSFCRTPGCPALKWKAAVRQLHDDFSVKVLEILPLPFIVTGSSCTRDRLRKSLSSKARTIHIPLTSPAGTLQLDMDFRETSLHRIIAHVHHPVAGFFVGRGTRADMAAQIDAGLNLMLWLIGKPFDPAAFSREYATVSRPASRQSAPLADMWSYIRRERGDQLLTLEDYKPSFLGWVSRYLGEDPAAILARGQSVANQAALQIRRRMSIAQQKRHARSTTQSLESKSDGVESLTATAVPAPTDELIDHDKLLQQARDSVAQTRPCDMRDLGGAPVFVRPNGTAYIGSDSTKALSFRLAPKKAKEIIGTTENSSLNKFSLEFGGSELHLKRQDHVVYTKPFERLLMSSEAALWLVQLVHQELLASTSSSAEENQTSKNKSVNIPRVANSEEHWRNPELRNRLLQGQRFKCTRSSHGGGHTSYRVYFRGVTFYVPQEADPDAVFLRCFLAQDGQPHRNRCIESNHDDPCRRLAIQMSYTVVLTGEKKETWLQQRGKTNICKLNSIVDFLEEKPIQWTEAQPRRFLDRNVAKGRLRISYTSRT